MEVPVCSSRNSEKNAVEERISACRHVYNTIRTITPPSVMMNPVILSKLYWSLCVTKMTYGMVVWPVSVQSISVMERSHIQMAKSIQCLPAQTSDPACLPTLGWRTIESHVDAATLLFLRSLLNLSAHCLYIRLVISRLTDFRFNRRGCRDANSSSPIGNMYRIAVKYGLAEVVHNMLDTGHVPTLNEWHTMVNSAVDNLQLNRWRTSCLIYSRLQHYMDFVPEPKLSYWWHVCKSKPSLVNKCKTLIAIVAGEHSLGCGKGKYIYGSKMCQLCDHYAEESVSHFLVVCPGLEPVRSPFLSAVLDVMPPAMVESFSLMPFRQQTFFLLGEMGRTRVNEWESIHRAIIVLVHGLYKAREEMLKDIST